MNMRRTIGAVTCGALFAGAALLWFGEPEAARAQVVTTEILTLELDSVWLAGARSPVPLGHEAFDVTLTPGAVAGTIVLRAADADGFTYEATYTSRGPN